MELDFFQQSVAFFYSILLGVALGIIYGPFKMFRIAFCSKKLSVFVADVIYMLIFTLFIFYFSLAMLLGYIRIYVFIGCLLGIVLYRCTLGRLFSHIYCPIISFIKKISLNIQTKIKKSAKKLLKITYNILYNISTKIRIFRNKNNKKQNTKRANTKNEKRKSNAENRKPKGGAGRHKRNKT